MLNFCLGGLAGILLVLFLPKIKELISSDEAKVKAYAAKELKAAKGDLTAAGLKMKMDIEVALRQANL